MNRYADNDDNDADIIGGWIIVRSVLTPSRTKNRAKYGIATFLEIVYVSRMKILDCKNAGGKAIWKKTMKIAEKHKTH